MKKCENQEENSPVPACRFTSEFKIKLAIEALKERYSLSELAECFELHPNQISQW